MDSTMTALRSCIIKDLDATYIRFLEVGGFTDEPSHKAGFFAAALQFITRDPIPHDLVQSDVVSYIKLTIATSAQEITEEVELMFEDILKQRLEEG